MSQPVAINRYLAKRAITGPWRIEGSSRHDFSGAVIIPALAESAALFATLRGLAANPPELLERFLILVVVNHRQDAAPGDKADNRRTLQRLTDGPADLDTLQLAWIDAAGCGLELPVKSGGVGLARKIGADLALTRLDGQASNLLVALDADTLVRPDYLPALTEHFAHERTGAAVVPFCHQPAADTDEQQAITAYELYQRAHVLGLQLAGSPYAFHTVGSTMACRAAAYARAGGMNRRQAGEDFYFLQQLAKTAGVSVVKGTVVYPSARVSQRTPFGTGRSVARLAGGEPDASLCYHPRCYAVLGAWLKLVERHWQMEGSELLERAGTLNESLGAFLSGENLPGVWDKLSRNHGSRQARLAAFHGWFDGLKTTRLIHHLSAGSWPRLAPHEAVPPLLRQAHLPVPGHLADQLRLLRHQQIGPGCRACPMAAQSLCRRQDGQDTRQRQTGEKQPVVRE
jgi:hypothetical protein